MGGAVVKKGHPWFLPFLALVTASALSACGSATSPTPGLNILASVSSQTATSLTFRIGVENTGTKTESLNFRSSQFFDIEVRDAHGRLVWRLSDNAVFLDLVWSLELAPGESSVREYAWDLTGDDQRSLPAGSYRAWILITNSPRNEDLATDLRLTI